MKQAGVMVITAMSVAIGVAPVVSAVDHGEKTDQSSIKGIILALDLHASTPTLRLSGIDGKVWSLLADPRSLVVLQGGHPAKADQLQIGDLVTITYEDRNGRPTAKAIDILSSAAPHPTAAVPQVSPEPSTDSQVPSVDEDQPAGDLPSSDGPSKESY